ncbi:sulfotransferase family 2 domain-containing protein [Priestia endophytica]|uniref:sulfotransferase family 2 domain-containing protein n=1 Tax=Priestia endophytica TaxID=135735 RepID=UPI00124DDC50|nr:sulfotransferase family 2 domain-containing protein [Priestia endophytica]KAB2488080.1 sulfotransferase family protein [Priestia endophytica]
MDSSEKIKRIFGHRVPHYQRDFPIILFWSPRSGCTSFVKWFFFQIGLLDKALQYNPWVHYYELEVYKRKPNYLQNLILEIMQSEKEIYKLVRNPYRRAVSSFIMFTGNPIIWGDLTTKMKQHFYNDKNSKEGFSFKQFLQYLKTNGADVYSMDPHFSQQYVGGEERYVNKYIYLENFNNNIRELENKYGLVPAPLDQLSQSSHHFNSKMIHTGNYANVRTTDPSFPNFPTFESFYDEETKMLVEEVFKKDFETYLYNKSF